MTRSWPWNQPEPPAQPFADNVDLDANEERRALGSFGGAFINDQAIILPGSGVGERDPFEVRVIGGTNPSLTIYHGTLDFRGLLVSVNPPETLSIPPNNSGFDRKDALCIAVDYAGNEAPLAYLVGQPRVSNPQPPLLTKNSDLYHLALAYITVPSNQQNFNQSAIEYVSGFGLATPFIAAPFYNTQSGRIPLGYPVKTQNPATIDRAVAICNADDPLLGIATQAIEAGSWGGVATEGIVRVATSGIVNRFDELQIGNDNKLMRKVTGKAVAIAIERNDGNYGYTHAQILERTAVDDINITAYRSPPIVLYQTTSTNYVRIDQTNLDRMLEITSGNVQVTMSALIRLSGDASVAQSTISQGAFIDLAIDNTNYASQMIGEGSNRILGWTPHTGQKGGWIRLRETFTLTGLSAARHIFSMRYHTHSSFGTLALREVFMEVKEI